MRRNPGFTSAKFFPRGGSQGRGKFLARFGHSPTKGVSDRAPVLGGDILHGFSSRNPGKTALADQVGTGTQQQVPHSAQWDFVGPRQKL